MAGPAGPAAKAAPKPAPKADRKARPALSSKEARWPKALNHRMSRYAVLDRVQDRDGDLREGVREAMVRTRETDVQGDRLELARARLSSKGRLASRNASLDRRTGDRDDRRETRLATLTRVRARADLRRLMIIPKEELAELRLYQQGLLEYGDPFKKSRIGIAQRAVDRDKRERGVQREDRRAGDQDDRTSERDVDEGRYLGTREHGDRSERLDDRHEERRAEKDERKAEQDERKDERKADKDDEKAGAKTERELERDAEKESERSEEAEDRSDERTEERNADRSDDKSIRQAEENTRED